MRGCARDTRVYVRVRVTRASACVRETTAIVMLMITVGYSCRPYAKNTHRVKLCIVTNTIECSASM